MKPLPQTKASLWGAASTITPYLLDYIHGNGKQFIFFETLAQRPNYYVVRIDSGLDVNNLVGAGVWEEIVEAIEEESVNQMSEAEMDEYDDKGWPDETLEWPTPDFNCGEHWGNWTPNAASQKALKEME